MVKRTTSANKGGYYLLRENKSSDDWGRNVRALIEVVQGIDTCQEDEIEDVYYALVALEEIGSGTREAIPTLVRLRDGEAGNKTIELQKGKTTLRALAIEVIQKIEGKKG